MSENTKDNKLVFICLFISFIVLFIGFLLFNFGKSSYSAKVPLEDSCTKEAVLELSKIIYKEVGPDCAKNSDENFYLRLSTAAVIMNNANSQFTEGSTWYNRIYNLPNWKYQSHTSYRDKSFDEVVKANQNQILYISQLVLTGKYSFPTSMIFQASKSIVEEWGTVWDAVYTYSGFDDIHFGYEYSLNNTDIWGRTIPDTSKNYFRNLANQLELSDYSSYTIDNICQNDLINNNVQKNHKVYFHAKADSDDIYKTIEVKDGERINLPVSPSLDGFIFKEWHYRSGDVFSSDTLITEDLHLYAYWEETTPEPAPNPDPTPDTEAEPDTAPEPEQTPDNNQDPESDQNLGTPSNDDNTNTEDNPQTSDKLYLVLLISFTSLIISMYFYKTKINVSE